MSNQNIEIKTLEGQLMKRQRDELLAAIARATHKLLNDVSTICEESGLYGDENFKFVLGRIIARSDGDAELNLSFEQTQLIRNLAIEKFLHDVRSTKDSQTAILSHIEGQEIIKIGGKN